MLKAKFHLFCNMPSFSNGFILIPTDPKYINFHTLEKNLWQSSMVCQSSMKQPLYYS